MAATLGHVEVAVPPAAGADPGLTDVEGRDALQWARQNGHQGVADLLVSAS